MTPIRRLDHVALVVGDTGEALKYFSDALGLEVAHTEELQSPPARLTYLNAGNTFIQLVEPLDSESELAQFLNEKGEGVHHLCFGVRDVEGAILTLSAPATTPAQLGQGRGRVSGFLTNGPHHGVSVECTEFLYEEDVLNRAGWLVDSGAPEEQVQIASAPNGKESM